MNKNIFLWALYDFGNGWLGAAVIGLFFSQWVIIDKGFDDLWYGLTFALSSVALLLTAPFWGTWSDRVGRRMPFLTSFTLVTIACAFTIGLMIILPLPTFSKVVIALILFFFMQYFYQNSLTFYNTLLDKISTPSTRGKISGIGIAFAWSSWIIFLPTLLFISNQKTVLFGEPGRAQVFLPAAILCLLFVLPTLLWLREEKKIVKTKISLQEVYAKTIDGLRILTGKNRNVGLFLFSFMLISDAVLTAQLYFAIFLDQIYKISDTVKVGVLISGSLFAITGGFLIGKLADKYGSKKLLVLICLELVVVFSGIALLSAPLALFLLVPLMGLAWGGFEAVSRVLLISISPKDQLGEHFGLFSTFQRFASIIGPLMWGGVTLALKDAGTFKYRIAAFSLILVMVVGIWFLAKVQEKPAVERG